MASKKKPIKKGYTVVALSAKTDKPLKSPRKGQQVTYAIKGPRGGIKQLRKEPQKYFKTDLQGIKRIIQDSSKATFVLHEQKLRTLKRDSRGKIQYRVDAKGTKHKMYETKLTFAKPRARTKEVLFKSGKKLYNKDLAFKKGNYAKQKLMRNLLLIKPNTKPIQQVLTGNTIKNALSNIHVDVDMAQVRKRGFGVYYNIFVVITTPTGQLIKVPVSAEFIDREFEGVNYIPVNGEPERFGRSEVKILANLQSAMAKSIRYALKNTGQGYTFTTLATLEQIEKREMKNLKKAELEGDDMRADKIMSSISGLYFGNNKRKLFINKKTKLTPLKPKYKVTMYVKFELMYD